jgi:O-antigen/teichoic acid export membrane protein
VLILGFVAAINLPLSVYTGVLIGLQRNEFPAIAIATSRLLGAVAVLLVLRWTHSLAWLALCIGGFNLVAALVQCAIVRKLLPTLRFSFAFLDRATVTELIRYCSTLSVWSFGMLLVSGLDVTIIGLFNFKAVGAYSIAATLIMFFTGLNSAAFSAFMAPVAVLQARQDYSRIRELLLVTTRLNSYASLGAIAVTCLFGRAIIRIWVGPEYLALTLPILEILLVAQAIRLVGSAYGMVMISMGLQRYGIVSAIAEGSSNLLLSVLGMIVIGSVGVAWATLIAALIGFAIITWVVLPRIRELSITSGMFIQQGIVIPFLPFLPFCLWMVWHHWFGSSHNSGSAFDFLPESLLLLLTIALVTKGMAGVRSPNS